MSIKKPIEDFRNRREAGERLNRELESRIIDPSKNLGWKITSGELSPSTDVALTRPALNQVFRIPAGVVTQKLPWAGLSSV